MPSEVTGMTEEREMALHMEMEQVAHLADTYLVPEAGAVFRNGYRELKDELSRLRSENAAKDAEIARLKREFEIVGMENANLSAREMTVAEFTKEIRTELDEAREQLAASREEAFKAGCKWERETNPQLAAAQRMIRTLLKSAHPHPVEHPTMTAAWAEATAFLRDAEPSQEGATTEAVKKCTKCPHPAHEGQCRGLVWYERPGSPPGNGQCVCGWDFEPAGSTSPVSAEEDGFVFDIRGEGSIKLSPAAEPEKVSIQPSDLMAFDGLIDMVKRCPRCESCKGVLADHRQHFERIRCALDRIAKEDK